MNMKIANLNFTHGLFLSPMAGVTEVGFREVCEEFGAEMCVSEMLSAKGLYYNSAKTKQLLAFPKNCKCRVVQLFGNDENILALKADVSRLSELSQNATNSKNTELAQIKTDVEEALKSFGFSTISNVSNFIETSIALNNTIDNI